MKSFNVINFNFNTNKFEPYDVMPYLVNRYKDAKPKPKTEKEFKEFIEQKALNQFWGRCEYEVVLHSWPCDDVEKKIDVYEQIMMNIDVITSLLMENVKAK